MWRIRRYQKTSPIEYVSDEELNPTSESPPRLKLSESLGALANTFPSPEPGCSTALTPNVTEGYELMNEFMSKSLSENTQTEYKVCLRQVMQK